MCNFYYCIIVNKISSVAVLSNKKLQLLLGFWNSETNLQTMYYIDCFVGT